MSDAKRNKGELRDEDIKPISPDDPQLQAGYIVGGRPLARAPGGDAGQPREPTGEDPFDYIDELIAQLMEIHMVLGSNMSPGGIINALLQGFRKVRNESSDENLHERVEDRMAELRAMEMTLGQIVCELILISTRIRD